MKSCKFAISIKNNELDDVIVLKIKDTLTSFNFIFDEINPDIIIVLGGDGTLLRAIHKYGLEKIYLPINTGHLGFFSDYDIDQLDEFLSDITTKEPLFKEEIPAYESILGDKKVFFFNDIAIQSNETCFFDIKIDGKLLSTIRCNGLVVSTPMGSTGYLTSLNSPVMIGKPEVYQYSTISPCYNRLSLNPINKAVVPNSSTLSVSLREGFMFTFVDGIKVEEDITEFEFTRKENNKIYLLHFKETDQIKRLRKNISGLED